VKSKTWTELQLREATSRSRSLRQILQFLHLQEAGGNYEQIKKYLRIYNIDTNHLKGRGWNKGLKRSFIPTLKIQEILVENSTFQSYKLRNRLFKENIKKQRCELCGWAKISEDGRIPLELDHINGNKHDNRLENLRILCPNCHSLQATHRGLNSSIRAGGGIGRRARLKSL
jgi:hypothetical protein